MRKSLNVSGECAQDALSEIAHLCEWSLRDYETEKESESPHYWNGWLSEALRLALRHIATAELVTAKMAARLAEYED